MSSPSIHYLLNIDIQTVQITLTRGSVP